METWQRFGDRVAVLDAMVRAALPGRIFRQELLQTMKTAR
jgi:hypothetical protein